MVCVCEQLFGSETPRIVKRHTLDSPIKSGQCGNKSRSQYQISGQCFIT